MKPARVRMFMPKRMSLVSIGFASVVRGAHGFCWSCCTQRRYGYVLRGVVNSARKVPEWAKSTQDNGRFVMPLFITQGRFTHEYIRGGLAKPEDRHAVISKLIEQAGGKLVSLYITLGQYDFLVVSEMPDAKAASILAFVATGGGGIEGSVTTQAFTTAEARDMFETAGKLAGSYKPIGAA